jgi:hypothetical protein
VKTARRGRNARQATVQPKQIDKPHRSAGGDPGAAFVAALTESIIAPSSIRNQRVQMLNATEKVKKQTQEIEQLPQELLGFLFHYALLRPLSLWVLSKAQGDSMMQWSPGQAGRSGLVGISSHRFHSSCEQGFRHMPEDSHSFSSPPPPTSHERLCRRDSSPFF